MILLRNKKDISIFRMKKAPYLLQCLHIPAVLPEPVVSVHVSGRPRANFCHKTGLVIMKTCLFKYIENFTSKNGKFQIENSDIFIFLLKT